MFNIAERGQHLIEMLPISDQDRIARFDAIFIDWLGGRAVYEMMIAHRNGCSYRDISEQFGVPLATVHTWVTAAKVKLRRVGMDMDKGAVKHAAEASMGPSWPPASSG